MKKKLTKQEKAKKEILSFFKHGKLIEGYCLAEMGSEQVYKNKGKIIITVQLKFEHSKRIKDIHRNIK